MANWSNPQLTSTYTNFVTEVKDRDVDLALQFDGTTSTNIPTNTIRWNSSINRWQKWSGSAWGELTSTYALNALSVSGTTALGTATATTVATGDNSTNIATTAWVKAQNYLTSVAGSFLPLSGGTITGNLTVGGTFIAGGDICASGVNGGSFAFRNKIINGDFAIDQYNSGAVINAITATAYFTDRWQLNFSGATGGSIKGQQNYNVGTVGLPRYFNTYFGFENNTAVSQTSADAINIQQRIEGFNVASWQWGIATSRDALLSFYFRTSVSGTYGVSIQNAANDMSYVTSFLVTAGAVNTWTAVAFRIPSPTTGSWFKDNGVGIRVRLSLGCGTSSQTATTNSWISGNFHAPTGAVSWVGTAGATFFLTGVQFEPADNVNAVVTDFENPPLSTKLALCQRYFYNATQYVGPNNAITTYHHPVRMRATPTVTGGGTNYNTMLLDTNGVAHYRTVADSRAMTYSAEL